MTTKTIPTRDLTGAALDWAVACADNVESDEQHRGIWFNDFGERVRYSPSTDWSQGGPIIERERIGWFCSYIALPAEHTNDLFDALHDMTLDIAAQPTSRSHTPGYDGPTQLIAAMRCYVASKLGATVDVPEQLL